VTEAECHTAAVEALDALPDWVRARIVIYRSANPNADEVRKTVWHEVGHYMGMAEEQLEGLGYG
jgi:predicted Zn-dependent protease with MMP-like domain